MDIVESYMEKEAELDKINDNMVTKVTKTGKHDSSMSKFCPRWRGTLRFGHGAEKVSMDYNITHFTHE